mmetsp:Transcript_15143/g.25805  ORF Transcript_15143/g.25805 Transcript_15143/m.25805 type:complete len:219 (+) Transcript_15143:619-1275(+)
MHTQPNSWDNPAHLTSFPSRFLPWPFACTNNMQKTVTAEMAIHCCGEYLLERIMVDANATRPNRNWPTILMVPAWKWFTAIIFSERPTAKQRATGKNLMQRGQRALSLSAPRNKESTRPVTTESPDSTTKAVWREYCRPARSIQDLFSAQSMTKACPVSTAMKSTSRATRGTCRPAFATPGGAASKEVLIWFPPGRVHKEFLQAAGGAGLALNPSGTL